MSEESISHKEDTENLLYIARKLQIDEDSYGEDHPYMRESVNSETSVPSSKDFVTESELKLLESVETTLGPNVFKDPQIMSRTRPFELAWSFGLNSKVNIVNLSKEGRTEVLYASCNYGMTYNYCEKKLNYFANHPNVIVAIESNSSGRWVITVGNKDGYLHIWDWEQHDHGQKIPVFTMYALYDHYGVLFAKISPSGKYIITIGTIRDDLYSVDLWLWTLGNEVPEDSYHICNTYGCPVNISFNLNIEEHIMIIFTKQVFLLVWDPESRKFTSKVVPQMMHKNKLGHLTGGTYADLCHECYASSSKGCIAKFGNTLYAKPYEEGELDNNKFFVNAVKVSPVSIDCLTTCDGLVVSGDARGEIYFFNKRIEILYWLRDFNLGPISSISFNLSPKLKIHELNKYLTAPPEDDCNFIDMIEELELMFQQNVPTDASKKHEPFIVRDFVVATAHCNIYAINVVTNTCTPLFHIADGFVAAIEVHEESNYIIIAYTSNRIVLMDYEDNVLISETVLPKTEDDGSIISCIKYSLESFHLVCGKTNGELWILEPILLTPKITEPFQITKNKINKIQFSHIPIQFAYYDDKRTVCLFAYHSETSKWEFKGKIRAHYDDITDIMFIPVKPAKLCTIARDRHLIQYNNDKVNEQEFDVESSDRIEQNAIPMCFIYWLSTSGDKQFGYILIADDRHKLKFLYHQSKVPKSLVLGPAFGCFKNQQINKMKIIPHHQSRYMAFCTNKHFGIHILPPDGNQYKYCGYLAHPEKLQDFVVSNDGNYIFTFGINDHCVFKWKILTRAVETMKHLGGTELEPFYCLIEGGYHGWLFHEIKDLFYYIQILQQENIDLPRRVTDSISLNEIADLFRTIGYYPSEFELENIMIDVKYRNMDETNKVNDDINFIDFVKLYCNYKPVYGYSNSEIEEAFKFLLLYSDRSYGEYMNRDEFIEMLMNDGEPMTRPVLLKCFKTLMRVDSPEEGFFFLPEEINFQTFFEDILGIEMERERVLEAKSSDDDEISAIKSKVPLNE